ncbi:hypothetical protein [Wenzhouxiangella limi]|uniref:Uncharacterized protein n=1 Tax=Wenzhouxiangella limi TaxID=2707351 RepID=A0A845V2T1_9GAMM|nr:hypothetical protein [Wenzhouxiangella limi]NDY96912.1 hypothetical protein [Wenzhouxiangella limi]
MLPIARNNAFHVPHGLAALAAAVCLVLAFTSDFSQRQKQVLDAQADPAAWVATAADDPRPDITPKGDARPGDKMSSRSTTRWIPWFPGLRPGGG